MKIKNFINRFMPCMKKLDAIDIEFQQAIKNAEKTLENYNIVLTKKRIK